MTSLDTWISENIPDVVMDDAATWLARLDSQHCNEADRLAFARWLAEDPTHRWAFQELSEIWARLHTLTDVGEQLGNDKVLPFPIDGGYKRAVSHARCASQPSHRRDWSALAASVILTAAVLFHMINATPADKWSTGTSEMRQVRLEDGSSIELNAKTDVIVRIDGNRRAIDLTRGEAVFHVTPDERPFVVRTPQGTIAALGTSFVVDSRVDLVEVAVIVGEVAVSANPVVAPLTEIEEAGDTAQRINSARLAAGEGAEMRAHAVRPQLLPTSEIEQRLAWRGGSAWFEQQPLVSVLEDMRRYTDLSIHIGDPELRNRRISGRFSTHNIDDFFSQLTEKYNIFVDRGARGWVVLRPVPDQPGK